LFVLCGFYARFLSNNSASNAPTTMIATNKPAIAGTKYRSAADEVGVAVGASVGCAASTAKADSVYDGQYPFEPWKVATTVYLPVMSGVH